MPIPLINYVLSEGISGIPYFWTIIKTVPWLVALYLLKWYCGGAVNTSERNMHSKVVLMTGGTSGIGASVARELATRGAQIVLLTQHPLTDPFLVEYIMDLRTTTNNELITAEEVDLTSLHSVRKFATKWVDNAPPRRLDMVILCANTQTPAWGKRGVTEDGIELDWGLNYVANFHLLSILSPALRAQPPDRDVRILFGTCSSYIGGSFPEKTSKKERKAKSAPQPPTPTYKNLRPARTTSPYANSKLALMTFAQSFQKHLSSYVRPDKQPNNARILLVNPGWTRTPGMQRFLTFGSLWGLLLYIILYPLWWLLLKSADQGAQSFLYAAMEAGFVLGEGGAMVKECSEVKIVRDEVSNDYVQQELWKDTETIIQQLEKEGAVRRAKEAKLAESEKKEKEKGSEKADESGSTETANAKKAGSRRSRKAGS
ncbi:NAD(P)-binding protein [Rhizodiscina lignyota]|uniref:NAD(P)-binding protein n=1 Tax=Rhizodiscina lignyota TaxID=1504668 RepID=A0A9P4M6H4_9PEZI|nr:NAD(P)-binding protein [Rhizodiscina lignyota]